MNKGGQLENLYRPNPSSSARRDRLKRAGPLGLTFAAAGRTRGQSASADSPSAGHRSGEIAVREMPVGTHPILRYRGRRRPSFLRVAWLMSATLLWLCALGGISNANPAAFVQVSAATPQANQSRVSVTYAKAQVAGDTDILAIGWQNATSDITSIIDSTGNTYHPVATARGNGLSQAIYYARNIKAAGANTVTVTFNTATPFIAPPNTAGSTRQTRLMSFTPLQERARRRTASRSRRPQPKS